ncbi:MAG TPA: phage holin family protein [Candidatus Acidoferrales bacterium]|nr:phage holin family protein [Candidatus Acidoferrales bacterium]
MTAPQMQRSVPEILEDIASNLAQLVQAEFRLAKTELKEGAEKVAGPGATLGAGVALAFYGLGFLLLAAVYALSLVMAGWLATLIVGGVLTVAAGILISVGGTKLKRLNLTPDKTILTLEEDVQWAKQQIK